MRELQDEEAIAGIVALTTLLDLLPGLAADPDRPPPRITGSVFRSPPRLDVVFSPRRGHVSAESAVEAIAEERTRR